MGLLTAESQTSICQSNIYYMGLVDAAESQTSICQSNIYYMGLVDENADSDETMMLVTEKIMDELKTKDRNSHLIIVGDGKTYEHLKSIKRHYGSELDKLLVFPGDWHILKNYQEVLMKVY